MSWLEPPTELALPDRTVHLWYADLNQWQSQAGELRPILSQDERDRADRFRFERDRIRFILCRGILRQILSCYLQTQPKTIQFAYTKHGKPYLIQAEPKHHLGFNLSHSQQTALIAVIRDREVGVDLEYIRPVELLELADRFFSAREAQWLRSIPAAQQQPAFFQLWTAKEAYLKAIGTGLSQLTQIEIDFTAHSPQLIDLQTQSHLTNWTIQPIEMNLDCIAHLAIQLQEPAVQQWRWHPGFMPQP